MPLLRVDFSECVMVANLLQDARFQVRADLGPALGLLDLCKVGDDSARGTHFPDYRVFCKKILHRHAAHLWKAETVL